MTQSKLTPTRVGEAGAPWKGAAAPIVGALLAAGALLGCAGGEDPSVDGLGESDAVGETTQEVLQPGCVTIARGQGTAEDATITFDPTDPSKASANSGTTNLIAVGAFGAATRESLVSFVLTGKVPSIAVVTSATLTLTKASNVGAGTVLVHRAAAGWSEGSVTWNSFNQAYDPTIEATLDSTINGAQTVDVTALVKGWQAGTIANEGLLLEQVAGTGRTTFGSAEASPGSLRPRLYVCYTAPSCSDGLQNQGEGGVDCGGPCANACTTCSDGIQNQGELGIDCGGPCVNACPGTCSDFLPNQGEAGVDCGGPCATPCIPIQVEGHADVLVGCDPADYYCQGHAVCSAVTYPITGMDCLWQQYDCYTGSQGSWYPQDGISGGSNFNFAYAYDFGSAGSDYGNICACDANQLTVYGLAGNHQACGSGHWLRGPAPTCVDGVKNGTESGVDCGGSCATCPNLCGDGVLNSDEAGVDCGGTWCGPCPFLSVIDTSADDMSDSALFGYFSSLGAVTSSQYIFFEVLADNGQGGAWCSDNADFYVNNYLANYGQGNAAYSGNWPKYWRNNGGNWSPPDTGSYANYYGNYCLGNYGWCTEWGMGSHYLGIAPGGVGPDEAYANGWGNGTWQVKVAIGNDISVCGIGCTDGVQNNGETGLDCGGTCAPCTDMCNDGIKNSDEVGTDCGGTFCGVCPAFTFTDTTADDVSSSALYDYFASLGTVASSQYIYFEVDGLSSGVGGAWCSDNADFYVNSYLNNYNGGGVVDGGWAKYWRTTNGAWSQADYGSYWSYFGGSCDGNPYSWCSQWGLGGQYLGVMPGQTGSIGESLAGSWSNGAGWNIKVAIGSDISVCGIIPPSCSDGIQNQGEVGLDCGGPCAADCCSDGLENDQETGLDCGGPVCAACTDMCADGIKNSDEGGVDCGGTFCAACPFDTNGVYAQYTQDGRNVYIWKSAACAYLPNETNFCANHGLSWWSPTSQADAQQLITFAYNLDQYHTWIQTYGTVVSDQSASTLNGYGVSVDGAGCVESSSSGWTAVRKWACSYCDPESNQNESCCWDKSHAYDWFVCEGP